MARQAHLSLKEVSGLAARVLATALMPPGAIGAAAEAVEVLELTGRNGLARLDAEKEGLLDCRWTRPEIVHDADGIGLCDLGTLPALFCAASVADWLAAMAAEHETAVVALRGGSLPQYLDTTAYFLAMRGLSGLVSRDASVSMVRQDGAGWTCWSLPAAKAAATTDDAREALAAWRRDLVGGAPCTPPALPPGVTALVCATRRALPMPPAAAERILASTDYAALKGRVLGAGWPMERALWESLMRFADRSLVKSSERSRQGAG